MAIFVVGLREKVGTTDIEKGMRVSVESNKYSVAMMIMEEKPNATYNDLGVVRD